MHLLHAIRPKGWRLLLIIVVVVGCSDDGDRSNDGSVDVRPSDAYRDTASDSARDGAKPLSDQGEGCAHPKVTPSCNDGWCVVPAGCFKMGSPAEEPCRENNEERHQVTLTRDFEIQRMEVTQGEFELMMGYNPSSVGPCGDKCPVDKISWHEAAAYCNEMSAEKATPSCYRCSGSGKDVTCQAEAEFSGEKIYGCSGYRLPTEAEWEYAYRAGTKTAFYSGPNDPTACGCDKVDTNADRIGWFCANVKAPLGEPHEGGQREPNAWGLYDMAGNVAEWCHDDFFTSLGISPVIDPVQMDSGDAKVARGGSWDGTAGWLRASYRWLRMANLRLTALGFRCVRTQ